MPRDKLFEFDNVLNKYDFDFRSWPIIFKWTDSNAADLKRPPQLIRPTRQQILTNLDKVKKLPFTVLSYLAIKLFGRRMMYPGSVDILQMMMQSVLNSGRYRLIEHYGGKRYKLQAIDKNEIDSLFIDNRGKTNIGSTLVVCCEGRLNIQFHISYYYLIFSCLIKILLSSISQKAMLDSMKLALQQRQSTLAILF